MPLRMWGIGSEAAPSTSAWSVVGFSFRPDPGDDGADVEGPGHRGDDRRDAEGGAVVGAGEVEGAGDVGERRADARAGQDVADLRGGRAAGGGLLLAPGLATSPPRSPRRGICRCRRPCRSPRAAGVADEAGDVLLAVSAGQAHREGRVGAGGVVGGAGFEAGGEGRGAARRAGGPAGAGVDLEAGGGGQRRSARGGGQSVVVVS